MTAIPNYLCVGWKIWFDHLNEVSRSQGITLRALPSRDQWQPALLTSHPRFRYYAG